MFSKKGGEAILERNLSPEFLSDPSRATLQIPSARAQSRLPGSSTAKYHSIVLGQYRHSPGQYSTAHRHDSARTMANAMTPSAMALLDVA
eukprot:3541031-Rhodomonas_salina.3